MSATGSPADGADRVSVVIVTYDRASDLGACLRSLGAVDPPFETIVVDNASSDGTAGIVEREFPGVRLVRTGENLGFGRAANRGAAGATGDLLLFLNDDTLVAGPFIGCLADALQRLPKAGVVGPRLRNPDGSIQASVFRFPSAGRAVLEAIALDRLFPPRSPLGGYGRFGYDGALAVDFVSGACFLVRRETFLAAGGFDERFFMYGEETDLALRLRRAGWRSWFVPCGDLVHLGGVNTRPDEEPPAGYLRGHLRYCAAHMGAAGFRVYLAAKILGYLARGVAACAAGRAGRVRRSRVLVRAFAGALVTGRGPLLAGQPVNSSDKVGPS